MIERRTIDPKNKAEWLEWRKPHITASVIGALWGLHPTVTRLRLNVEHRGVEFPTTEDNKLMRRGRWLEPSIGAAVAELRPDWSIKPAKVYLSDPDLRLGATPDFFIEGDPRGLGILEAKSLAPKVFENDWENGPPKWIELQATVAAMMADAKFACVAGLIVDPFNMDCHLFEFPRDPQTEAEIAAEVRKFWREVEEGRDPEPDFSRDSETIRALFPKEQPGKTLDLSGDNHIPDLLDERVSLQREVKNCDARLEEIDAEIKFRMQDAETITGLDGWRVTFKTTDRSGYTVAPKTIRSLRVFDKREAS
jgi:predicted phage-related endonuclease